MASDRRVYHVVTNEKGWSLQEEGNPNNWEFYQTKDEAIHAGMERAREEALGQLIIHKTDGTIEEERTYGDDPRSSRG